MGCVSSDIAPYHRATDTARYRVGDEIDADSQHGDRRGWYEDNPGLDQEPHAILVNHEAPVRRGWRLSQSQIAERTEGDERSGEPQPEVGQNRRPDVRQDIAAEDRDQALAAGDGSLDEFLGGNIDGHRSR